MIQPFSPGSMIGKTIMSFIQSYNHVKYWRRRAVVVDPSNKTPVLLKLWYLYYIKKVDSRHGCSFDTNIHAGASFATPPRLSETPSDDSGARRGLDPAMRSEGHRGMAKIWWSDSACHRQRSKACTSNCRLPWYL